MRLTKLSSTLLALALLAISTPAFADKIGIAFTGDGGLQSAIMSSLKAAGHEVVDVSDQARDGRLDAVAASAIGKKSGAEVIVWGRKMGGNIILKVLSTKNDTVQGGVPSSDGEVPAMVKELVSKVKSGR